MAMSFSRDDSRVPGEAGDVVDVQFSTARKGFDQDQVRAHLRAVAREMAELRTRAERLERERDDARAASSDAEVRLDDEALTRLLGEETARVLTTARESASEIRQKAEESAARLLAEAGDEATRLREEAELEASRRRADATNDAEAELSMAKQQGREMVNEARAYRERVLSELARRRELAREQIEQLVHGRDRLVAAFERARLAAVDVMAEMQPIGEPDEYVDLQPTTGPVPVMVARSDLDTSTVEQDDARTGIGQDDAIEAGHGTGGAVDAPTAPFDREATDEIDSDAPPTEIDEIDGPDRAADDVRAERVEPADIAADERVEPADIDADETAPDGTGLDDREATSHDADTEPTDDPPPGRGHLTPVEDRGTTAARVSDAEIAGAGAGDLDATDGDATEIDASGDEIGETGVGENADSDEEGDVVVDLFARLRASREAETDDTTTDTAHVPTTDVPAADDDAIDDDTDDDTIGDASSDVPGDPAPEQEDSEVHDVVSEATALGSRDTDPEPVTSTGAETPFERRDAEVTPLITSAARRLKRVLADEQNGVLEALRQRDAITSIDDLVPWAGEHSGAYSDAIADELLAAARAGAESTAPAGSTALSAGDGRDAVQHAADVVETWLVAPLRDRLATAVADGAGDNQAITKKMRSIYREFKTTHIDEHLDDIVRTAYGWGSLAGFPDGASTRWAIDPRTGACHPDCEDNALEGAVRAGEPFPTGAVIAPGHPGCVCLLIQAD